MIVYYKNYYDCPMYEIEALELSKTNIYIKCPYCRSGSKRVIHIHGNDGDMSNRIEYRGVHCYKDHGFRDFKIMITDNTKRI